MKILKYPDPTLRKKSEVVTLPLSEEDRELIEDMCLIMYKSNGVGLAAIQVGVPKRICVLDITPSRANPITMVNPIVKKKSDEMMTMNEGCLSAPGKQGDVKRHIRIILKYKDQDGKEQRKTFYNLEARCIQHEMDHLEGKLCIDYEKGEYSRDKHKSQTMVESDFRAKSDT